MAKAKAKTATTPAPAKTAAAAPAKAPKIELFDLKGIKPEVLIEWYKTQHLGRRLDEKAANYLKMAKGWSYHAPFAGHDGIQLALGKVFRPGKDFLFPYYRAR